MARIDNLNWSTLDRQDASAASARSGQGSATTNFAHRKMESQDARELVAKVFGTPTGTSKPLGTTAIETTTADKNVPGLVPPYLQDNNAKRGFEEGAMIVTQALTLDPVLREEYEGFVSHGGRLNLSASPAVQVVRHSLNGPDNVIELSWNVLKDYAYPEKQWALAALLLQDNLTHWQRMRDDRNPLPSASFRSWGYAPFIKWGQEDLGASIIGQDEMVQRMLKDRSDLGQQLEEVMVHLYSGNNTFDRYLLVPGGDPWNLNAFSRRVGDALRNLKSYSEQDLETVGRAAQESLVPGTQTSIRRQWEIGAYRIFSDTIRGDDEEVVDGNAPKTNPRDDPALS